MSGERPVTWRIRKAKGSWWAYQPEEMSRANAYRPRGFRFNHWLSALNFVHIELREKS